MNLCISKNKIKYAPMISVHEGVYGLPTRVVSRSFIDYQPSFDMAKALKINYLFATLHDN